ncbi:hypothetical protein N658DRAFT_509365 [Parathielavia hyrcaniae]|uniref:Uncharacterized protein n=1 Tax=Parathielavia hyrcaniae TaxID=113614 RepID=A0AAN6PVK1_9PEZI|nr:hypothetical protein N658DRAFT_509365 [Parathielavia hyrcaniae]
MSAPSEPVPGTASHPTSLEVQAATSQGVERQDPRIRAEGDQRNGHPPVRMSPPLSLTAMPTSTHPYVCRGTTFETNLTGARRLTTTARPPLRGGSEMCRVVDSDVTDRMEGRVQSVPTLKGKLKRLRRKQKEIVSAIAMLRQRGDNTEVLDELAQTFLRHTKHMRRALRRALRG